MIFSNLFHRKKNKESETGSFSQYDQSEYAKLETKNIVKELNLSDAAQAKKYVVDLCKQMIQASKDMEDSKSEYQLVTNYLTDIQILENLTDAERKPILECATQVAKLEKQRTDFLKTKRRLTDTQFAQMQEEEENLPGVIRRLKANEADLDAIKRNMAYLEGKKLEWFDAAVRFRKGTESNPYRSMLSVSCIYYVVCFCGNTFLVSEQGSAAGFHHYGICSCGSGRVYFDPLPGFHKRDPSGGCQPQSGDYFGEPGKDPLCQYEKRGGFHL